MLNTITDKVQDYLYEKYRIQETFLISLQGSRAMGTERIDSDYDIYVVSAQPMISDYMKIIDGYKKYDDFDFSLEDGLINVQHFDIRYFLKMVSISNYMPFAMLFDENILYSYKDFKYNLLRYNWNWKGLVFQTFKSAKFFMYRYNESNSQKDLNLCFHRYYVTRYILNYKSIPKTHNIIGLINSFPARFHSHDEIFKWLETYDIDTFQPQKLESNIDLDALYNRMVRGYA